MSDPLRVALLLDPLSVSMEGPLYLRVRWGTHASNLARELLGRGHSVRGFGAPGAVIPRSSEDAAQADDASWSALARFQPDSIVAYDALSPAAARGARMARKLKVPLCLVESAGGAGRGRLLAHALTRLGEFLWGPYVRRTAGCVVAIDERARDEAVARGFDRSQVIVVPHGLDLEAYRPGLTSTLVARARIRGRILLAIGKLTRERGVDLLLAAFARTVGQRGDWNLVLAGDGPEKADLRAMADRLGVSDHVHWLPRPRDEELPGLLGAATLFAVPARADVVLGQMAVRAMACGVPVVLADLPRLSALIRQEEEGLIVPAGDVEAWCEGLRRAASSPVTRKRWALAARERILREVGWPAVGLRFESLLVGARARGVTHGRRVLPLTSNAPQADSA